MKTFLQGISNIIAPRVCRICGCTLGADEDVMCVGCLMQLPRTSLHREDFNIIHQRLGHVSKIDRAAAWFYYKRSTPYAKLLVDAKYAQLPVLARRLGEMCAEELAPEQVFDGVDYLVPMPMHWLKRMRRGYNQAQEVCRGISRVTGIEVITPLRAVRSHGTQARHSVSQRYASIAGTLSLKHPEQIMGHSIMFVDDIITTGATASEALATISAANPSTLHILSLGLTMLQ